jgi:hypothetical protein
MSTTAQITANQASAQKSTGPLTTEGKTTISPTPSPKASPPPEKPRSPAPRRFGSKSKSTLVQETLRCAIDRNLCGLEAQNHNWPWPKDLGSFEIETYAAPQRCRNVYKRVEREAGYTASKQVVDPRLCDAAAAGGFSLGPAMLLHKYRDFLH